jgi:hypothetical protein
VEIPTGFLQANFLFGGPGYPLGAECTMGFDHTAFIGDPQDAADFLWTTWIATIGTYQVQDCYLTGVLVKYGPNLTGPSAIHSGTDAGTIADDPSPPAVSWLVRKITLMGGRAGRGRMYIPGLGEGATLDGGVIATANVNAMQTQLTAFMTAVNAGDLTPVLLHGAGSPITTPTPLTSLVADGRAATQRRRQRR